MNELFKQEIVFDEDAVYLDTTITKEKGYSSVKRELIITKEAFIQCYNKWIKENKDGSNCN